MLCCAGARARVGLTGLTVAEYFRDEEGQDVLLFVDNIFRFTQACSEVSSSGTCIDCYIAQTFAQDKMFTRYIYHVREHARKYSVVVRCTNLQAN